MLYRCSLVALLPLLHLTFGEGHNSIGDEDYQDQVFKLPEFVEPIPNITLPVGREVVLYCTVKDLDNFKVAWIKVDTQTLLSIHTRVITRDKRFRVTHNNFKQWFLHIKNVQLNDKGFYMCQINTIPMVSQMGYVDVMVPPAFVESATSSDETVEEMSRVCLRCKATGYPPPVISWRREDGRTINSGLMNGRRSFVSKLTGEHLNITQATRDDMGAYLCIASNGIPPSVSKRIILHVSFRPKIRVPNQLVGAALGTDVTLECMLEASPQPLTSWIRQDGTMLLSSKKFQITEEQDGYRITMQLRIDELTKKDFGSYKCVGKNLLGEKEGYIRLYEISKWQNMSGSEKYEFDEPATNSLVELGSERGRRKLSRKTGSSEDQTGKSATTYSNAAAFTLDQWSTDRVVYNVLQIVFALGVW